MMDIMEGQQKDARIAELERKLSAALGAVDFWQTAREQAEAALAERDRMLRLVWDTSIGVAGVEEVEGKFALWLAETRNCVEDGMGTL